ncbi:hypothetical protein SDC9_99189 [bioreactor metagenome]|uniref:Uncharacterized protein n=1 Tax=bioreactor metagenome TaxID=1076179 RepID=A0A645AGU7_9ZZZZ
MVRCAVGYNRGDSRLRAGACRGRHGKEQRELFEHAECAAHLRDALVWLDHARAGCLRAVHRGTAAKRDDTVTLAVHIELSRGFDVFNRGVGFHTIVDNALEPRSIAGGKERIEQTELSKHAVGDDQDVVYTFALDKLRQFFDAARPG